MKMQKETGFWILSGDKRLNHVMEEKQRSFSFFIEESFV